MFSDIKDFLLSFFYKLRSKAFIKKFAWLIIICALTVFIPLSIALCYNAFIQEEKKNTSPIISVSLFDSSGNLIDSVSTQKNIINASPLVNVFYNLSNSKTEITKPLEFNEAPNMSFTLKNDNEEATFRCYFDENAKSSYMEDEYGNFYSLSNEDYSEFLTTSYTEKIYEDSAPPVLYTIVGDPVLPKRVEWTYTISDDSERISKNYESTEELLTYRIARTIGFDFSSVPDNCDITVKSLTGEVVFSGTPEELTTLTATENSELLVTVNAKWKKQDSTDCYGNLEYEFKILCAEPSTFHINKTEATGGQVILLTVSDVDKVESIIYEPVSKLLNETATATDPSAKALQELYSYRPIFVKKGSQAYALLPVPINIPDTSFTFSLSCGISKSELTVNLKKATANEITVEVDDPFINTPLMNARKAEFSRIISYLEHSTDSTLLLSESCLLPTEYGFTQKYGYNTKINGSFNLLANTYSATLPDGISVQSASIGRVSLVGRSDLLGNYVIIDHGMGVCTWYCGLSDVSVNERDIVKKGDPIGRAGSTSLMCENGVNLICSVGGILIDPSELISSK